MTPSLSSRIERFINMRWWKKRKSVMRRIHSALASALSRLRVIRRLEPGFLWISWGDVLREEILSGDFERAERLFVNKFLRPGMIFLDIGAYYGLYSLAASILVGSQGRVIAFEPSPFQRNRLLWHTRLNRCPNVVVEPVALGNHVGDETLFAVATGSAGYSSLRRPAVDANICEIKVSIVTLDQYLRAHSIGTVDLIKIDVEGGELDVFKGSQNLLKQTNRPIILCELEDVRTEAWGHKAKDVEAYLQSLGYLWFRPLADGRLEALRQRGDHHERNFVAVPPERMSSMKDMIAT